MLVLRTLPDVAVWMISETGSAGPRERRCAWPPSIRVETRSMQRKERIPALERIREAGQPWLNALLLKNLLLTNLTWNHDLGVENVLGFFRRCGTSM